MKRILSLLLLITVSTSIFAKGEAGMNASSFDCKKWVSANFSAGKMPPFSFELDGIPSSKFIKSWKFQKLETEDRGFGESVTTYVWTDKRSGLRLECALSLYDDINAMEWVLKFKNGSETNSPVISKLKVLDVAEQTDSEDFWEYCTINGCSTAKDDYLPVTKSVAVGDTISLVCDGGRPSSKVFPYFNLRSGDGGIIYAIGWSGMWNYDIVRQESRSCKVSLGLETLEAYLEPGEEIRTPRAAVLPWTGKDRMDGQNIFRRHMLAHHTPRNSKGVRFDVPSSFCCAYTGPVSHDQYSCISEKVSYAILDMLDMFKIPFDNFWIDAGWYEDADKRRGDGWTFHVGNWEVDKDRFPHGMKGISDEAHRAGATFTLWFEPERGTKKSSWSNDDTFWYSSHPDYFIDRGDQFGWLLLDLAREDALEFCCKEISRLIRDNGVDIYRQDFNFGPNAYWVLKDKEGRKGIEEIRYVTNLYKFLDYLRAEFPDLLIDNCSSGGRRLDLEMMSRSLPFWRTDYDRGESTGAQIHGYGLSQWLPEHSGVLFKTGQYASRSAMGPGIVMAWNLFGENIDLDRCRADATELKKVSSYYLEDFYPLSGYENLMGDDIWLCYQLHKPSDSSGYIIGFRRPECKEKTCTVKLEGLNPDAKYILTDDDKGNSVHVSGKDLMEGYKLSLEEAGTSVLISYISE